MRRYPVLLTVLFAVCVWEFALAGRAWANGNPVERNVKGLLFWRANNENKWDDVMTFDKYDPDVPDWETGWRGHYTDAGTPYHHYHCTSGFPYESEKQQGDIDAAMVDAYWDTQFPGYTQIQDVDQSYSCHAYSTEYVVAWIDTNGMGTILEEEYEPSTDLDAVLEYKQYGENFDHSKRLFELYVQGGNVRVRRICEKSRDSGVYKKDNLTRLLGEFAYEKK